MLPDPTTILGPIMYEYEGSPPPWLVDMMASDKGPSQEHANVRQHQSSGATIDELQTRDGINEVLIKGKQPQLEEQARQEVIGKAHDEVLKNMLKMMESGNAQGFVYGVVLEDGKVVGGASDGLKGWWNENVRFEQNGPAALAKYRANIELNTTVSRSVTRLQYSLIDIQDRTLRFIISSLLQHCDPPQRRFPFDKGIAPPWWPSGYEHWWPCEGISNEAEEPPPYKKPHNLKKAWKVAILTAIVKHMLPNYKKMLRLVKHSRRLQEKMTIKENTIWTQFVMKEKDLYFELNPNDALPSASTASSLGKGIISSGSDPGDSEDVESFEEDENEEKDGINPLIPTLLNNYSSTPNEGRQKRLLIEGDGSLGPHNGQNLGFSNRNTRAAHHFNSQYQNEFDVGLSTGMVMPTVDQNRSHLFNITQSMSSDISSGRSSLTNASSLGIPFGSTANMMSQQNLLNQGSNQDNLAFRIQPDNHSQRSRMGTNISRQGIAQMGSNLQMQTRDSYLNRNLPIQQSAQVSHENQAGGSPTSLGRNSKLSPTDLVELLNAELRKQ
ncbi:putative transcription factor EIL family [Dioscorea sansibarensis]